MVYDEDDKVTKERIYMFDLIDVEISTKGGNFR